MKQRKNLYLICVTIAVLFVGVLMWGLTNRSKIDKINSQKAAQYIDPSRTITDESIEAIKLGNYEGAVKNYCTTLGIEFKPTTKTIAEALTITDPKIVGTGGAINVKILNYRFERANFHESKSSNAQESYAMTKYILDVAPVGQDKKVSEYSMYYKTQNEAGKMCISDMQLHHGNF